MESLSAEGDFEQAFSIINQMGSEMNELRARQEELMVKSADRALEARECGHIAERHARLADIHSGEVVDFRNEEQNLRVAMHRLRSEI